MAGPIDQHHQRQRYADSNAVWDAQCQLGGDHDCRKDKFPAAAGKQLAQIIGPGEVKHCGDHDRSERGMRHAAE